MGFHLWEIQVAFSRESQLRQSCYPTYGACWVFLCFNNPLNFDMDYRIFNVRTDVNTCNCTWGCMDTRKRESALKVDSGRKIPRRTGESNLRWWRAGPTLYQLSYIPVPHWQTLAPSPSAFIDILGNGIQHHHDLC